MIKLYKGDCLTNLNKIADNSIDMVLSDLPYGTTKCKWDSVIDLVQMWDHLTKVIKPGGVIALTAQAPFDKVLACSNLKMFRYEWIYEKANATGFLNAKKMPLKAHENVLIFYDKLPCYNAQKTTGHIKRASVRKAVSSECYGDANKQTSYNSTERYPRSVIKFSSDKQKLSLHPTQKPVELGKYLTKTYTNIGETVLDITMGVGSFGVAAVELDRNFIGMELEENYFSTAFRRLVTGDK